MKGNKLGALFVIAFAVWMFYATIISDASGLIKFVISAVIMAGCGISLQALLKIEGQYGLLLIKTKSGLHYIDDVANAAPRLWQFLTDLGLVMGYGLSSIFFFKELPKKTYVFSVLALIIVSQLMTQKVFEMIVLLINVPMDVSLMAREMGSATVFVPLAVLLATLFFGFCGMTVVALALQTYTILQNAIGSLFSVPGANLSDAVPGAYPILPGINMPLAEGVLALAVLLFIHELSHGILSRIGKVRLDSAGVLLFGIIPVGAFIDPDEKSLLKKAVDVQTRVFAAGSASNLFLFMVAFFALSGFEVFTAPYLDKNVYISSVDLGSPAFEAGIKPGDQLASVDQLPITWDNYAQLGAYISQKESVTIRTDKAAYTIQPKKTEETTTIGLRISPQQRYLPAFFWLGFIKNTLGLILVLNFLVGVINLVPLFMAFDGYRILTIHNKNQLMVKIIAYSLLVMFLLNLLPWAWT